MTCIRCWLKKLSARHQGCKHGRKAVVIQPSQQAATTCETFTETSRGCCSWQTLISQPGTATDSLTVGVATCPPKEGRLCPHRHFHAEIYHIIQGKGVVRISGVEHKVGGGSIVFVSVPIPLYLRPSCSFAAWIALEHGRVRKLSPERVQAHRCETFRWCRLRVP